MLKMESEEEQYLKGLSKDRLSLTPHDVYKIQCCVLGCDRFSRLKDFGIAPYYYWGRWGWQDLSKLVFYCGKHWKQFKAATQHPIFELKEGAGEKHLIFDKSVS